MLGKNRRIFTGGKFAVEAVFTIEGSAQPLTLKGVFDNAFYNATLGENNLEESTPRLTVTAEDAAGIVRETPCEIDGKKYSVIDTQPDGIGLMLITLAHEIEE